MSEDNSKEEIEEQIEKGNPTYIMVPKKFVIAWISSFIIIFVMMILSIQYANYIDRRSNQRFCGIFNLSTLSAQQIPNPTELQKQGLVEIQKLQKDFSC